MKKDKINPGPKEETFTKRKNGISPRGTVPKSKGSAGADEQFNKGESYDEDDGSSEASSVDSHPGSVGKAGSANTEDEQFDDHHGATEDSGHKSKKSSGGTPGKFDSSKPNAAASIMREVARALMKGPGADQKSQSSKKVSSPKSESQTKDFNSSSNENEQGRSKTQRSQVVSQKKQQSKPGSKT